MWATSLTCALNRHFTVSATGQLRRKNPYIYLMCAFLKSKIRGNEENKKGFFSWGSVDFGAWSGTGIHKTELFSDPSILL